MTDRMGQGMSSEFIASLTEIGRMLMTAEQDWCLIGGAAAALYGAHEPPPSDIDVLMSVADAERILARHQIAVGRGSGTAKFRSRLFSCWKGTAVPVDFMAGFEVNTKDGWVPVPPKPVLDMPIGDAVVRLPSVKDLIAMYRLFDRPKDAKRISSLSALPT